MQLSCLASHHVVVFPAIPAPAPLAVPRANFCIIIALRAAFRRHWHTLTLLHTHRSYRGHEHFARCVHTSHHSLPVACGAAVRKTFGGKVPTTRMTLNFGACNMQTTCMFRQNRLLWPVKVCVSAKNFFFQKVKNACWPPSASSHSAIANTSFEPQRKPPSMPNSCCQSLGCKRYESYTNITGHII